MNASGEPLYGQGSGNGELSTPMLIAGWAVGMFAILLILMVVYAFHYRLSQDSPIPQRQEEAGKTPSGTGDSLSQGWREELERLHQENGILRRQLGLDSEEYKRMVEKEALQVAMAREENGVLEKEKQELLGQIQEANRKLHGMQQLRAQMLTRLREELSVQGMETQVDEHAGRLHFPGAFEFPSGSSELQEKGKEAVKRLSQVFQQVLSCYSGQEPACTKGYSTVLDGVFVEGHTDSIPIQFSPLKDNWALSSTRAAHVLHALMLAGPGLREMRNERGESLFRVGGYGDRQPLGGNTSEAERRKNRRVEFRFVMVPTDEPSQER